MHFAHNLKKLRKYWGFDQFEMAEALGVSRGAYQTYEQGRSEPKMETLNRLFTMSGVSLYAMLEKELRLDQVPTKPLPTMSVSSWEDMLREIEDKDILVARLQHHPTLLHLVAELWERVRKLEE